MPKIINKIREKLMREAKRQVLENGYTALTIRSVAKACDVGVGTVYNYFTSKEMLVASFMLEDWQKCYAKIVETSKNTKEIKDVLYVTYEQLHVFSKKYEKLFKDEKAETTYVSIGSIRHKTLRDQIASILLPFVKKDVFKANFIAENILIWTFSEYSFEHVMDVLLNGI
jgi:AcrR family transcriptional regulator